MDHKFPRPLHIDLGPGMSPRDAACDALQRFVLALDLNDADLMRSAFTEDGVLDKSGLKAVLGSDPGQDEGIDKIIATTLALIGPMDSSHHLSNFRVKLNNSETEAEVTCYVYAQHYRRGDGLDPANKNYVLFANIYYADVVKMGFEENALWKIKRIGMHGLWIEGDLSVVL